MKIKKEKIKFFFYLNKYYLIFAFILGLFVLKYDYVLGDDINFREKLFSQGLFNFVKNDYLTWSGRISSTLVYGIFLPHINIWKIFNTIVAFLFIKGLSYYYRENISNSQKLEIDRMILICFFFINMFTVLSSYVWMTGSFQYIWAVTAFIYAMFPFYKILFISNELNFSKYKWLWFYICMFYASYVEQEFLIILVLGIISLALINRRKNIFLPDKRKLKYFFLFFLINFIISRITPGLENRVQSALVYYPNWENTPFIYRFFEAFILSSKNLIMGSNLLFFVFLLLMSILVYKKFGNNFKILFLPLFYIVLKIIPFDYIMSSIMLDNNKNPILSISKELYFFLFDIGKIIEKRKIIELEYLPIVITLFIVIFSSFILLIVFEDKKRGILNFLIYWAGLFSTYILAFMPVMYGIGSRVFFITGTCLLFIISQLYLELKIKYQIDRNIYFRILTKVLAVFSFLIILNYYTGITENKFF